MNVKRFCKKFTAVILTAAVIMSMGLFPATAAEFPDMDGHWTETNLQRAVREGVLNGFEDGTLRPDENITMAQALKIICSVLKADYAAELTETGIGANEWYAEYAAKAIGMGLSFKTDEIDTRAITRSEAFTLLADALRLTEDAPDLSVLDEFADVDKIPEEAKAAFAALVKNGYVNGDDRGLSPERTVSRAEFITVLYRIAATVYETGTIPAVDGNMLISSSTYISGKTYDKPLFIGCASGNVTLNAVKAKTIVYLGQNGTLYIGHGSEIERLVIAGVGSSISVNGNVGRIEVEGSSTAVNIYAKTDALAITGSGCNVNLTTVCQSVYLAGTENTLSGYGTAVRLMKNTATGKSTLRATETVDHSDYGIVNTKLDVTAQEVLPAGEALTVTAKAENYAAKECTAVWMVDGTEKKRETVTVSENTELTFTTRYRYTEDMAEESEITLTLLYTTAAGEALSVSDSVTVKIENHDESYYNVTPEEALERVTCEYAGDYTLEWALANDYPDNVKEIWINAKGYESETEYLCWINLTYQRVNIFKGEAGSWELVHTFLGASGAGRNATPVGEYTVFNRSARGWKTASYWCKPVVNFYIGTGYAFHSRLYHPTKGYLTEPDIGYPVSHGCIRMYDEDIQWIFDNIPNNTKVVVH